MKLTAKQKANIVSAYVIGKKKNKNLKKDLTNGERCCIIAKDKAKCLHNKAECSVLTSALKRPGSIRNCQGELAFFACGISLRAFLFLEVQNH